MMNKGMITGFALIGVMLMSIFASSAFGADIELSEDSTLEGILKRGKLRIGLEVGYMPFEMLDKRGGLRQRTVRHGGVRRGGQQLNIIGFDIDMGREMAKELGVQFVPVDTVWPSIIPALNVGRFDIIMGGMSVTEVRKLKVDFADPFMTIGQTVLLNKKHRGKVTSYKDLNAPEFIVTSKPGTTGEEAVMKFIPECTYKPFGTETAGADEVLNGNADAFVYDLPFNAVFTAMHGTGKLVFLDKPFTTEPIAWAIRKDDPDFLNWLNKFLKEIKADGRFEKLYDKWFRNTDWFRHVR
ncbi:transporter substrate-binding domain-containing protein [Desulfococcaceae bacterium HSG8]|nr:transporter substrate-binding domain-containing protein [Desulfococcaceae bacterium HSG8]